MEMVGRGHCSHFFQSLANANHSLMKERYRMIFLVVMAPGEDRFGGMRWPAGMVVKTWAPSNNTCFFET